MRISDWSSDVCSSDLCSTIRRLALVSPSWALYSSGLAIVCFLATGGQRPHWERRSMCGITRPKPQSGLSPPWRELLSPRLKPILKTLSRSEEHTSELQSLMRISYAVFCLKKKSKHQHEVADKIHRPKIRPPVTKPQIVYHDEPLQTNNLIH